MEKQEAEMTKGKDIGLLYTDYSIVFQEIPSEVTLAINLSGCPNACEGCHSPHLQEMIGVQLTESTLRELITPYEKHITCVCFMGGDGAPQEVMKRCLFLKKHYRKAFKTAWYSGKQDLPHPFCAESLDFVKLGPYIARKGPLNQTTTNQRLYRVLPDGEMQDITACFWKSAF
ncbi:MAG: 4Fe-4S cluster-binding domain-containing protein [Bacteroidaceae bacterium]